jgi:uncharacterized integral membrane protein (TIGR00697 family)
LSAQTTDTHAPSVRPFELSRQHQLYLFLVALFVTCLLVADIVAGKYFEIGGVEMSVGTVAFPIAFLLTDIVNEYYGQSGARLMTGIGMSMLVIGFGIIFAARLLPAAAQSPVPQTAFDAVFGLSGRLFGASLMAYLISQFLDIYTFHIVKRVTASRHLWLRAIGSTALSQVIDTAFVNFGANVGLRPFGDIATITVDSYLYKLVVAVALTPLCYVAHEIITRRLGIDPVPHEQRGAGIPT